MATKKEYLDYVLEQLSELSDISYRMMMGEYILYYRGKIIGDICDDCFLVKITPSSLKMMPETERQIPYEGAKPMLLVDRLEDRCFLRELIEAMYEELPEPKKRKKSV